MKNNLIITDYYGYVAGLVWWNLAANSGVLNEVHGEDCVEE